MNEVSRSTSHAFIHAMYPSISTCPFMEWSRKEKIIEKKSSAAASSTATAAAGAASTAAADSASISRMRFYIFCMAAKNGSCSSSSSRKRCGKEAFLRSPGDGQTCSSVRPSFFQTRPGFPLVLRLLLVLHMMLLSLLSLLQIRAPHPPCDYSCCCCCCCSIDMWHHFLTSTRTHTYVCLSMHARTL